MISKQSFTEINEIINNLPEDLQEKIPIDLRNTIKANMDKQYKFNIKSFELGNILDDTKKVLSVIYTDYLSTEEERKIILAKERILKSKNKKNN